jgi:hypothetical protein
MDREGWTFVTGIGGFTIFVVIATLLGVWGLEALGAHLCR